MLNKKKQCLNKKKVKIFFKHLFFFASTLTFFVQTCPVYGSTIYLDVKSYNDTYRSPVLGPPRYSKIIKKWTPATKFCKIEIFCAKQCKLKRKRF